MLIFEKIENLSGTQHKIYINVHDLSNEEFDIVVHPGHYFMMGDNRDDSADSRYWGFVSDDYLRGKALLVWMSWDAKTYSVRWSRIGRIIH